MLLTTIYVAGSLASLLTLPSLWLFFRRWYREAKEQRAPRGVSESCLEFLYGRTAINLVRLSNLQFLPRAGDMVWLPSEPGEKGAGYYEVVEMSHSSTADEKGNEIPCPARPVKIVAIVKKRSG